MRRALALSAVSSLIVGILSNVVAAHVLPTFAGREWISWVALIIAFSVSLLLQVRQPEPNARTRLMNEAGHAVQIGQASVEIGREAMMHNVEFGDVANVIHKSDQPTEAPE